MDKREFYKQLMENYTIDAEKIKCNAKRRYRTQTAGGLRRWGASIAACTAVAAAAFAVVSVNNLPEQGGVTITAEGAEAALERLRAADNSIGLFSAEEQSMDFYVSFARELSHSEILMTFSKLEDYADIKLNLLYTESGSHFKDSDDLDPTHVFLGAKISAPSSIYSELKELKLVSLVEIAGDSFKYNDDTFIPFKMPQEASGTLPSDQTIQLPINSNNTQATESSYTETSPAETEEQSGATSETTDITVEIPPYSGPFELNKIAIPVTNITYASFISEQRLVVTTADSIRLYRFDGSALQLETTFYASGAKVSWSSSNNGRLYITACDEKGRNKMFLADGSAESLVELDLSAITAGGFEIASILCDQNGSNFLIKTVSLNKSCIFYAKCTASKVDIALVKEFDAPVSVISFSGDTVYTMAVNSETSTTAISAVKNGEETRIATLSGKVKYVRNISSDLAIITATVTVEENTIENSYLLTTSGTLVPLDSNDYRFYEKEGKVLISGNRVFIAGLGGANQLLELTEEQAKDYLSVYPTSYFESKYSIDLYTDGTAEIISKTSIQ